MAQGSAYDAVSEIIANAAAVFHAPSASLSAGLESDGRQFAEALRDHSSQKSEFRIQKSEVRRQKSEVRSQKSEDRSQRGLRLRRIE
jgi:hypothetical protein